MIVRPATELDASCLTALAESVMAENLPWLNYRDFTEEYFLQLLVEADQRPNSIVLVAEHEGALIGDLECLGCGPNSSEFSIFVHRDHRSDGIASALLQALLDWALLEPTLSRLQAKFLEPNVGSRRLLEKFGFLRGRADRVARWSSRAQTSKDSSWTDRPNSAGCQVWKASDRTA